MRAATRPHRRRVGQPSRQRGCNSTSNSPTSFSMRKHLIVNADDLGISQGTNRAIQQAFRHGIVTSASLMANMAAFCDAVDCVIPSNPGLGIGEHLSDQRQGGVAARRRVAAGRRNRPFPPRLLRPAATVAFAPWRDGESADCPRVQRADRPDRRLRRGHRSRQRASTRNMLPALFPMVARIAEQRQAAVRIPLARHLRSPLSQRLRNLVTGGVLKTALLSLFPGGCCPWATRCFTPIIV